MRNARKWAVAPVAITAIAAIAGGFMDRADAQRIDRHALVARHNVVVSRPDENSPVQVGNGHFAFGADITGLQTFTPFATMSDWGWHSFALPAGKRPEDFTGAVVQTHGRPVAYPIAASDQEAVGRWLYANPHRIDLGRLGLALTHEDGAPVTEADLRDARQELDLWSGVVTSRFTVDGRPVTVETACHPDLDLIAARITSPLVAAGRLRVFVAFPYADAREFSAHVGDWSKPDAHHTSMTRPAVRRADFTRTLDDTTYHAALAWEQAAELRQDGPHRYELTPTAGDRLSLVLAFAPAGLPRGLPTSEKTLSASREHWRGFWNSGGAIDLSQSKDPRWRELERRIVLSQYLMAVNEAGSLPPQESGLVNNGWNGKFHMEMYWWHAAHYALWDRWSLLRRSQGVYDRFLPSARERARAQGYAGARWPKCTGPEGRESPHPIHAWLIWQMPHPIFLAELDYRAHPGRATLERWRDVVYGTADFMASYAFLDNASGRYVLGPPLYVVSENTDPQTTLNPTFELSYWRFGLRTAAEWARRLGDAPHPEWERVRAGLAPLPQQDGLYVLHEGVHDMWTKWAWEHPALIGAYGMLPGDGVDVETMRRTFGKVASTWDLKRTWGWDFPMLAMCAARLGEPQTAVDMLLTDAPGFQFDERGLASGGPFPYFPSNGGLLYAVALMAAGWDGAPAHPAPGFPSNGQWTVRYEGLKRAP